MAKRSKLVDASEASSTASAHAAWPRHLNLGSGKAFDQACLNLDIDKAWHPDIPADACDPRLVGGIFRTERFGAVTLAPESFDRISAIDALEHFSDLVACMTNCLKLLRQGGLLVAQVPYDLSYGAWQDPFHVRAFNERSWLYYTDWFWYVGWTEDRFHLDTMRFNLSEFGRGLKAKGIERDDLIRTPRAVDSLSVQLRKLILTPEEKAAGKRFRGEARRPDQ